MQRTIFIFAVAIVLVALSALDASATLVRRQSVDEQLQESHAVVIGEVLSIESRRRSDGIVTYIVFDISKSLVGPLDSGLVIIRQVGGSFDGETEWLWGSPELRVHQRYLVFLSPNSRGAYTVSGLSSGAFDLFLGDDDEWWVSRQRPSGVDYLDSTDRVRDEMHLADLTDEITANQALLGLAVEDSAKALPDEYFDLARGEEQPEFAIGPNGVPIRWFEPDAGEAVSFTYNSEEFASTVALGPAVSDALGAWNRPGASRLRTEFAGEDTSGRGWKRDGVNRVSVDPLNQIAGSGCSSIIAIGGFTGLSSETITINGTSFRRAVEADVLLNDGYCDLYQNPTYLRYILTHELGHAMGLGHSADQNATMFGVFLNANASRGAGLGADDIAGAEFIYPPPPGPPDILSVTPSAVERGTTATLTISGSNLAGASVSVAGSGIGDVVIVAPSTSTQLKIRFEVSATAQTGSRRVTVTTPEGSDRANVEIVAIAAPTDLAARALSASSIRVTWTDRSQVETEYLVQRYNGNTGQWATIATLNPNATTYTDTGLRASKRYKYRVKIRNAASSATSNQAQATTLAN